MDQAGGWADSDRHQQFWLDLRTGQVEQGPQSPAVHRMGPYATRAEAEHAFEKASERSQVWDEEDKRWREEWEG